MTLDPGVQYRHFRVSGVIVMKLGGVARKRLGGILAVVLTACVCALCQTRSAPIDPGVRGGPAGTGGPLKGLAADVTAFFLDGQARFAEVEVANGSNNGLVARERVGLQQLVSVLNSSVRRGAD